MRARLSPFLFFAAFVFLTARGAVAMKPAPFENVDYKDPKTGFHVVSKMKSTDGYGLEGTTTIVDARGKELWTMPIFIGRHLIELSPDGSILVLSGSSWYGGIVNVSESQKASIIFERGKKLKEISMREVLGAETKKIANDRKLAVMGGGWVALSELIDSIKPDWPKRALVYKIHGSTERVITF